MNNETRNLVIAINRLLMAGATVHIVAWPKNIRIVRAYIGVRGAVAKDEFKAYHDVPCGFLVNGKEFKLEDQE